MNYIKVMRLPHGKGLPVPAPATEGAAGMDLSAANATGSEIVLEPGRFALVPTGFAFEIPHGFEGQVRPRSGLAAKFGVTVLNSPGTVDSDYRGEVGVILINHGSAPFVVQRGARIAQFVIAPVAAVRVEEVPSLPMTARGAGGFGSTG